MRSIWQSSLIGTDRSLGNLAALWGRDNASGEATSGLRASQERGAERYLFHEQAQCQCAERGGPDKRGPRPATTGFQHEVLAG